MVINAWLRIHWWVINGAIYPKFNSICNPNNIPKIYGQSWKNDPKWSQEKMIYTGNYLPCFQSAKLFACVEPWRSDLMPLKWHSFEKWKGVSQLLRISRRRSFAVLRQIYFRCSANMVVIAGVCLFLTFWALLKLEGVCKIKRRQVACP